MAVLGVNKVSVVAFVLLLLFISSPFTVMAAGADVPLTIGCTVVCLPSCNHDCIRSGFRYGHCVATNGGVFCCCST
ncbi:hypothetical protein MRB53_003741 [Persea americana]|uniref:Uncharacterized protein n=1 Tax=Persea americana TaxID=3435 RepID=A0ACC2MYX1_PERAE|nr:hypothetical protein MRB53_003741 [Persea americana]